MGMKYCGGVFAKVLVAALPLVAATAVSAAPEVRFMGVVADQTCIPQINGSTVGSVFLKTASSSNLQAAGSTSGFNTFTVTVTDCIASTGAAVKVATLFEGHNVTAAGNLGNQATNNAAQNVQIQLLSGPTDGSAPIVLKSGTPVAVDGIVVAAGQSSASYQFGARFISEQGNAKPGQVLGVAEYSVYYP